MGAGPSAPTTRGSIELHEVVVVPAVQAAPAASSPEENTVAGFTQALQIAFHENNFNKKFPKLAQAPTNSEGANAHQAAQNLLKSLPQTASLAQLVLSDEHFASIVGLHNLGAIDLQRNAIHFQPPNGNIGTGILELLRNFWQDVSNEPTDHWRLANTTPINLESAFPLLKMAGLASEIDSLPEIQALFNHSQSEPQNPGQLPNTPQQIRSTELAFDNPIGFAEFIAAIDQDPNSLNSQTWENLLQTDTPPLRTRCTQAIFGYFAPKEHTQKLLLALLKTRFKLHHSSNTTALQQAQFLTDLGNFIKTMANLPAALAQHVEAEKMAEQLISAESTIQQLKQGHPFLRNTDRERNKKQFENHSNLFALLIDSNGILTGDELKKLNENDRGKIIGAMMACGYENPNIYLDHIAQDTNKWQIILILLNESLRLFNEYREAHNLPPMKWGETNTCAQDLETIASAYNNLKKSQDLIASLTGFIETNQALQQANATAQTENPYLQTMRAAYNTTDSINAILTTTGLENTPAAHQLIERIRAHKAWQTKILNLVVTTAAESSNAIDAVDNAWSALNTAYAENSMTLPTMYAENILWDIQNSCPLWRLIPAFERACQALAPIAKANNQRHAWIWADRFSVGILQTSLCLGSILTTVFLLNGSLFGIVPFARHIKCKKQAANNAHNHIESIKSDLEILQTQLLTEQSYPNISVASKKMDSLQTWDRLLDFWLDWFAQVGLECRARLPPLNDSQPYLNLSTPNCEVNTERYIRNQTTLPEAKTWLKNFKGDTIHNLSSTIAALFCPVAGLEFTWLNEPLPHLDQAVRRAITRSPFSQNPKINNNNSCPTTGKSSNEMYQQTRVVYLALTEQTPLPELTGPTTISHFDLVNEPDPESKFTWPPDKGDPNNSAGQRVRNETRINELSQMIAFNKAELNNPQYPRFYKKCAENIWPRAKVAIPIFASSMGLVAIGGCLLTAWVMMHKINAWQKRTLGRYWQPQPTDADVEQGQE